MTDTPAGLAERMRMEGEKTVEFFSRLEAAQWAQVIYSEGSTWTVKDLLAHLTAAEAGITRLIEDILAGGEGSALDFNLDAYNERKVAGLRNTTVEALLAEFQQRRAASQALVNGLALSDLARTGRHPFLGVAALGEIIKLLYRHDQIHQRDIRKALL